MKRNRLNQTNLHTDYTNISYLQNGNQRQRAAYQVLADSRIFTILEPYMPVLTGTIPIEIDVERSDLDIICEVRPDDFTAFEQLLRSTWGEQPGFSQRSYPIGVVHSSVTGFFYGGFEFEIFAQSVPVIRQNAYRHMLIEARLLQLAGEAARTEIVRRKQSGMKTEPAFVDYFQLGGDDPYLRLLELEGLSDRELMMLIGKGD
ncbi:DUF4269 domain-containing protein [Brevibacillus dissolubilis]|uniref:DUF4269 domain-containing protein n=1 Tax=Brevibacillus dissolubilis TaxID=1844116 RepID=UPI0011163FF6|nr:DUF4269 domain-containing protein [Brevibacillus dissolubilis]